MSPRDCIDTEPDTRDYVIGVNTTKNEHMPLLHVAQAQILLTLLFVHTRWSITDHVFFAPYNYVLDTSSVEVMPD